MIFDADEVTKSVVEWQRNKSAIALDNIYLGTDKLIEAIVSYYDPIFRDDMIQECRLKLITGALQGYDSSYSLHTYLTTVFHNCCKTYMKKQYRISNLYEDFEIVEKEPIINVKDTDTIEDVVCRNRERFPSMPVEVIDDISEYILTRLTDDMSKKRGMVIEIMTNFGVSRHIATIIYHSTIIYLRGKYDINTINISKSSYEFSLLPDLREELGEAAVHRLTLVFSGLCVKIP
jgi:hypothetical protein